MLVHADGIDFHVLKPQWLAIGLFVALPAVFGPAIAAGVDHLAQRSTTNRWQRWLLPALLVVAFPPVIFFVAIAAVTLVVWVPIRRVIARAGSVPTAAGLAIRAGWLAVAVLGLVALVGDIQALT
jgi:phosphotransferase system  glucose/maltose/N-acetylglucosamine-specific IIC component